MVHHQRNIGCSARESVPRRAVKLLVRTSPWRIGARAAPGCTAGAQRPEKHLRSPKTRCKTLVGRQTDHRERRASCTFRSMSTTYSEIFRQRGSTCRLVGLHVYPLCPVLIFHTHPTWRLRDRTPSHKRPYHDRTKEEASQQYRYTLADLTAGNKGEALACARGRDSGDIVATAQ